MKRSILVAAAALFTVSPAIAASPLDGTWKGDLQSAKLSKKPDMFEIKAGRYTCGTCAPAIAIAADGAPHPVAGHDYFDALAVKVIDPTTVTYTYSAHGRVVSTSTDTLSADGNTLSSRYTSSNNAMNKPVSGVGVATRAAPAPSGAHATSGGWLMSNDSKPAEENLLMTLRLDGDTLSLSTPTGEHYAAKIGGPAVPLVGDKANTMIRVSRGPGSAIIEEDMRHGKVDTVYTYMPTADPAKLTMRIDDKRRSTTDEVTLLKQ